MLNFDNHYINHNTKTRTNYYATKNSITLNKIFRQAAKSKIIVNAHRGLYVVMLFVATGIASVTSLRIKRCVTIIRVVSTDSAIAVIGRNILSMTMQRHLVISERMIILAILS